MIVITEFMDELAVERLRRNRRVCYRPDLADRRDELFSLAGSCRALIVRNRTKVSQALLDAAPELACVGRLGVGLDNIDLEACGRRGIAVYPATGANDRSVAEYVVGTAMALLRGAYRVNRRMLRGEWPRAECAGSEISGKRLGLVGFGSIGQQTAKLASACGMAAAASDPYLPNDSNGWRLADKLSMRDLLSESDVLSVHVPLTEATRHLIGAQELAQLRRGAVVINTSRGGVVDEVALAAALRSGHLGGAALDVFENEPLSEAGAERFAGLENLILTPHIAGVTAQSNRRVSDLIADNVIAHLDGMG